MTWYERFWTKVAKTDKCWFWTGGRDTKGYGTFSIGRRMHGAHRVSYTIHHGTIPPGHVVDHTCHVHHCVNPDHLRAVTQKQNAENRAGANPGNVSGFRGVSLRPNGKWRAGVTQGVVQYYLGEFDTPEEANEAAKAKRLELFTHNDKDRITL